MSQVRLNKTKTDRYGNQAYRGYYLVQESNGKLRCSCGRELVQYDDGSYRCSGGYPIYRPTDGGVLKDKFGNLYMKTIPHEKDSSKNSSKDRGEIELREEELDELND